MVVLFIFKIYKIDRLDALVIEDPNTIQLQNIEDLQKELRRIQKTTFEKLTIDDLTRFVNKIFRVKAFDIKSLINV